MSGEGNRAAVVERKRRAAEMFVARLLESPARPYVACVLLHGSAASRKARPESDVDLLVFRTDGSGIVERACDEASFQVALETAESVEPLVYSVNERRYPASYFLYRAIREGEVLYAMSAEELRREEIRGLQELAAEYLEGAQEMARQGRYRLAVDLAYNAAELVVKGMVLLKAERLPKTHGGLVGRFGELYVRTGELSAEIGRRLREALRYRNLARYDRSAVVGPAEAEAVIRLAEELGRELETRAL
ncbi:MAG: HEPN domain-containing protein [Thermoflexales bacterium]|nr:HEPN domain-containing protein [Thermoflexales bacterium]